jgi:hypothetical protein
MAFAGNWTQGVKPNEWGDVFAGLAAPMAFLWLVLGFLQQGNELQLSTRALMLQVEELKNTVEHQRQLVEVTRQQVDASQRREEEEKIQRKRSAQPNFVVSTGRASSGGGGFEYEVHLKNTGAVATNIRLRVKGIVSRTDAFPAISTDEERRFTLQSASAPSTNISLVVEYTDRDGDAQVVSFTGTPEGPHKIRFELDRPAL